MKASDKRLKSLIESSIEQNVPNKNRILQSARLEMQEQKQAEVRSPRTGWSRAKRVFATCVASLIIIVVAVIAINNIDFYSKDDGENTPSTDNNTSQSYENEDIVFEFYEAYCYKVSVLTEEESVTMGVEYKEIDGAILLSNKVYYLQETEEIVMVESNYSLKAETGNYITICVATIYETDATHIKYEDITAEDSTTYEDKTIYTTYGYENGEYVMQCLYSDEENSYIMTVMSPDNFDTEDYYNIII